MKTWHMRIWDESQDKLVDGIIHELSHVNEEKRAARTRCGQYVELWPDAVEEGKHPTCLWCIAAPELNVSEWRDAVEMVNNRWQDRVKHCPRHLERVTGQGRCVHCGYAQSKPIPGRFGGDGV